VVVKRYPRTDTIAFKCWGSGVQNERLVEPVVAARVPTLIRTWSDATDEYAELAWVAGSHPSVPIGPSLAKAVGRLLGEVHTHRQEWWGSLDGTHRFSSAADAFRDRFAAAMALLGGSHADLAAAVEAWARPRLDDIGLPGPPVLVHGDFGPANLLIGPGIAVIDWEHARWGHAQEDWAKIRSSVDFPEPNGFGAAAAVAGLEDGWREVTGHRPPDEPSDELILRLYYAICLGVFFWPADRRRLAWADALVTGTARP
jgi:aminoglycoside phosphotransferase (APT) family kinase protein